MATVGVHEAKTRLSELLRTVESGEEVVVTRGGRAVARIVAAHPVTSRRSLFGVLAEEVTDPGDWDQDEGDALGDLFGLPAA